MVLEVSGISEDIILAAIWNLYNTSAYALLSSYQSKIIRIVGEENLLEINNLRVQVIRSRRRTISMEIKEGVLIVRTPFTYTDPEIMQFVQKHRKWIDKHMALENAQQDKAAAQGALTWEEINELGDKAVKVIPERVRYYAPLIGVTYGHITIRCQKTRWGSCSSKGNLNFNCLLMLAPPEVLDSVVVHELCHLKEMNHSSRFYEEILKVYPDYYKWHDWLKANGGELLHRASIVHSA